jgi:hypothetical protein
VSHLSEFRSLFIGSLFIGIYTFAKAGGGWANIARSLFVSISALVFLALIYGACYNDIESEIEDTAFARKLRLRFTIAFVLVAIVSAEFGRAVLK